MADAKARELARRLELFGNMRDVEDAGKVTAELAVRRVLRDEFNWEGVDLSDSGVKIDSYAFKVGREGQEGTGGAAWQACQDARQHIMANLGQYRYAKGQTGTSWNQLSRAYAPVCMGINPETREQSWQSSVWLDSDARTISWNRTLGYFSAVDNLGLAPGDTRLEQSPDETGWNNFVNFLRNGGTLTGDNTVIDYSPPSDPQNPFESVSPVGSVHDRLNNPRRIVGGFGARVDPRNDGAGGAYNINWKLIFLIGAGVAVLGAGYYFYKTA